MKRQLVSGNLTPLLVLIGLGVSFFGSLILAATFFPGVYNWRYNVISSLASPRDNPQAFWVACTGLTISGLLLIHVSSFLQKYLEPFASTTTRLGDKFFYIGAICLSLSALIVPGHYRIFGVGRIHEHLAKISSVTLSVSLIFYSIAILRSQASILSLRMLASFVVLLPIAVIIVSWLLLLLAYECANSSIYLALKTSLWFSLAFWEWTGAFCIYLFLVLLAMEGFVANQK